MKKGPQAKLELLCSQLYDEMGLPNDEKIQELETFLKEADLLQVNFHFRVKSTVMNKPIILKVINSLSMHAIDGPKKIILEKMPTFACYFNLEDGVDPNIIVKDQFLATHKKLTLLRDTFSSPQLEELTRLTQTAMDAFKNRDTHTLEGIRDELVKRAAATKK